MGIFQGELKFLRAGLVGLNQSLMSGSQIDLGSRPRFWLENKKATPGKGVAITNYHFNQG
jgi:hypothetical protein